MKLNLLAKCSDRELEIKKIKDSSQNGLPIRGSGIRTVGLAVDGCSSTFQIGTKGSSANLDPGEII